MFGTHGVNQGLRRYPFFFGTQHDRRAVGIIGTDIMAFMAAQALKTHPDIRLNMFDHMPQMDSAIGIRQGAGDENPPGIAHEES